MAKKSIAKTSPSGKIIGECAAADILHGGKGPGTAAKGLSSTKSKLSNTGITSHLKGDEGNVSGVISQNAGKGYGNVCGMKTISSKLTTKNITPQMKGEEGSLGTKPSANAGKGQGQVSGLKAVSKKKVVSEGKAKKGKVPPQFEKNMNEAKKGNPFAKGKKVKEVNEAKKGKKAEIKCEAPKKGKNPFAEGKKVVDKKKVSKNVCDEGFPVTKMRKSTGKNAMKVTSPNQKYSIRDK